MARPRKDIDERKVEQLAAIGCSELVGCSDDLSNGGSRMRREGVIASRPEPSLRGMRLAFRSKTEVE
jgi:hypothetical protein